MPKLHLIPLLLSSSIALAQADYSSQVRPLIQKHCTSCHRQNGSAPFSLESYSDVKSWSEGISSVLDRDVMPQGATARLECSPPGTFFGPRRLTKIEKQIIADWMQSGFPQGLGIRSEKDQPAEAQPSRDQLGEPDYVVSIGPKGFVVPGHVSGLNIIRNFPIDLPFKEDRFVIAAEILPDGGREEVGRGMKRIVHHAHLFYDELKATNKLIAKFKQMNPDDDQPGWIGDGDMPKIALAPWFPGMGASIYPEGVGHRMKVGARLVLQVHYAAYNENDFTDHTKVALWFAKKPLTHERKFRIIKNENFEVPANESSYSVRSLGTFNNDVQILSLVPHMHQLGKQFTVTAELPDGHSQCMLDVDWDFDHQNQYVYRNPPFFPAGTKIHLNAIFDNSPDNPKQFNFPPKNCAWGEADNAEMMLTMVAYVEPSKKLTLSKPVIEDFTINPLTGIIHMRGQRLQKEGFIEIQGQYLAAVQEFGRPNLWVAKMKIRPTGGTFQIRAINADSGISDPFHVRF